MRRYASRLLIALQRIDVWPMAGRRMLLRWAGVAVGPACLIEPGVDIVNKGVVLGRGVYINRGCFLDGRGGLMLGDRVHLGPQVCLVTSSHAPGLPGCRAGELVARPIRIGAGSWLGAGVRVLAGVTIGDGAVIAAGAVVIGDVPPHTLYAGIPATARRSLPTDEEPAP